MRCEKCLTAKKPHSVRLVDALAVTTRVAIFWDEENREHRHDPSWAVRHFECSNGHAFMAPSDPLPCPAEIAQAGRRTCEYSVTRRQSIAKEFAELQQRG
jgi:hypothetical protein